MSYQENVRKRTRTRQPSISFGNLITWLRGRLLNNRSTVSPRTMLLALFSIVLGGALACQVIWQHVRYTRTQVEVNQLERTSHELTMKIQKKELVVSRLERLDRIQRIAVNQLGMQPLDETPVLEMSQTQWVQTSRKGDEPMIP